MAALADLRWFIGVDLVIFFVAVVMSVVTTVNGGPLKNAGSAIGWSDILAIVLFWGAVLLGLTLLGLCVARFRQASTETRLDRAASRTVE